MAMSAIAALATVLSGATFLAAVGVLPWLSVAASYGGAEFPAAGQFLQIGATVFALALCLYLPSMRRVLRLEMSHRDFTVRMDDVARAYWAAHAADREGVFHLHREFDAVRERFLFLRRHPDLETLEPGILELAAQMSSEAREMAEVYSDEKVERARRMLAERRHETEAMAERIAEANRVTAEIRRLLDDVEIEEDMVRAQLSRLRADLAEVMAGIEGAPPAVARAQLRVAPAE